MLGDRLVCPRQIVLMMAALPLYAECSLSMLQSFTLSDAAIGYSDYGLSIKADPRWLV